MTSAAVISTSHIYEAQVSIRLFWSALVMYAILYFVVNVLCNMSM